MDFIEKIKIIKINNVEYKIFSVVIVIGVVLRKLGFFGE